MAPFAFSITKSIPWRNGTEAFSNVYHYDIDGVLTVAQANDIIDAIVVQEKLLHRTNVSFVQGRCWGPTNAGPAASETKTIKDLSGLGSQSGNDVYREATVVMQWYLGRSPGTGRKRFLRKYFHTCGVQDSGSTILLGQAALTSATKTPMGNVGDVLKNINPAGGPYPICAPNGDHLPLGTNTQVLDYLHTRQFKQ